MLTFLFYHPYNAIIKLDNPFVGKLSPSLMAHRMVEIGMEQDTPYKERLTKPTKYCKWCDELLDPEWAAPKAVFCSRRCMNAEWYSRHKGYHRKKYSKEKKDWERSQIGKRAGTSWRHWWIYLPDIFK